MEKRNNNLLTFGAGIGVGLLSIWAIIELAPFLLLGGAGYIILKGLDYTKEDE